jgi:hypothetical protein
VARSDDNFDRVELAESPRNRARGASGAENKRSLPCDLDSGVPDQEFPESLDVGVMTEEPVADALHGVDGAERAHVGGDVVEQIDDRLLVRHRDVGPERAERAQPSHGITQAIGPHGER